LSTVVHASGCAPLLLFVPALTWANVVLKTNARKGNPNSGNWGERGDEALRVVVNVLVILILVAVVVVLLWANYHHGGHFCCT
jgi:hypothetical protein